MVIKKIKKNYKQAKRRLTWKLYRKKRILNRDVKKFIDEKIKDGVVKLHLCCGDKKYPGYINIDIVPLEGTDIIMNIPKDLSLIPSEIASEVLMESGFEHFYKYQQDDVLRQCRRILKNKGRLILKWIPDFDLIVDAYINKKKGIISEVFDLYEVSWLTHGESVLRNSPHQLHKDIFTKDSMRRLLEKNGFKVESLRNEVFRGENIAMTMNVIAAREEQEIL